MPAFSRRTAFKTLFIGSTNASRSIMAEHLLRKIGGDRFEVFSAGLVTIDSPHPLALRVLKEYFQIDAFGARSRSIYDLETVKFDLVITVSDEAREAALAWRDRTATAHWRTINPATADRDTDLLRPFRNVGLHLHRRIGLLAALPLESLDRLRLQESAREIGTPSAAMVATA